MEHQGCTKKKFVSGLDIEMTHHTNTSNQHWSIPVWITSRSYFTGTEKARTIITNAKWWMHLVLTGLSSDMWSKLPQRFNLESLRQPLETIGIDMNDSEHRQEVEAFLHTLWQDGVLVSDSEANPEPNRALLDNQEESKHISSVAAMFNEDLAKEGILPSAFFELTYRCNERCVHCFNPRYSFDPSKELTTDKIIAVLAELEAMGTYDITFSGGEVSLRDDFFEIMRDAQRRNFAVSVFTNGQTSSEWIEELITFFPQTVGVSLYSANPEIHDATTQRKGSFEQSVRTIETLVKHGIRTTIKCPLMNHTVHGYKELLNLCDRLGGIPQFDFHISPATNGNSSRTIHQILDPEILALMFREPRTSLYVGLDAPNQGRARRAMDDSVCGAGQSILSVCPDGTVYPCNSLPLPLGNVCIGGIKKIWESLELAEWKSVVWNDFDECGMYADCAYCNFCPGMSLLESRSIFCKSKTCCATAKVRRSVASDLQDNKDPLKIYAQNHAVPFGMDTAFRPPTKEEPCEDKQDAEKTPETSSPEANEKSRTAMDRLVFHTSCKLTEHSRLTLFLLRRYTKTYNEERAALIPEAGSPAEENLTKEMLVGTARFFESGR